MICIVGSNQKLYQEWKSVHATIQKFQNSLRGNAISLGFAFFEVRYVLEVVNLFPGDVIEC